MLSRAAKLKNTGRACADLVPPAEGGPRYGVTGRRRIAPFGVQFLSDRRVTMDPMELTGRDFDRIPRGNVRVPVVEFARLWLTAERALDAEPTNWTYFGVAQTCRWLACGTVRRADGRTRQADAPITNRFGLAHEETIEAETLAAEVLLHRRPQPEWLASQPGWLPAVVATLEWAWRRNGVPPLDVPAHAQG